MGVWISVDSWGDGRDTAAAVGDGDADAKGFLEDSPKIWKFL